MTNPRRRLAAAGLAALLAAGLITGSVGSPAAAATTTHQAEEATISNGVVEAEHDGFTGAGYVNTANAVGAHVECARPPAR
jgi:hypothetical protein